MARPTHGKDRATAERTPEPATPLHPAPPLREDEIPLEGTGRRFFWLLVVVVWVGAVLLLWGAEIVGLVYRMLSANSP